MKIVKSLLLGSAAGLVAVAGAQAADLPVKAKPVEYVKVCSLYGVGFYYIPGTDTCVKLGGYVRAEVNFNAGGSHISFINGPSAQYARTGDTHTWRTRFRPNWDIRTQTAYGTLRVFTELGFDYTNGVQSPTLSKAFIQFAGFTFGKVTSFSETPWTNLPGSSGRVWGGDGDGNATNALAYTAVFGNGVSATIALEERLGTRSGPLYDRADAINNPTATAFATTSNGGLRVPDIVGNIRVDQAWGTAFLSATASQRFASYYGATEDTGHPSAEWGYKITGGLNLKVPQTGVGDQLWVQATYTKGITNILSGTAANANTFGIYGGGSGIAYQSLFMGYTVDGVFNSAPGFQSDLDLTKGWGVSAGYEHYWVPGRLRTSLFGAYASISYSDQANAWLCSKYGFASAGAPASTTNGSITNATGVVGSGGCDFDWSVWQVGSRSVWTPVAGLDFSAEVIYSRFDQNHTGFLNTTVSGAQGVKPAGFYELKDQSVWTGLVRVQRTW